VQHSDEYDFFKTFMQANLLARRYDDALEAARNLSAKLEVRRDEIILREDWAALILHFMGREGDAIQAANAALFRLEGLRNELGEDYRIDLAEARVSAIQGRDTEIIRNLIQKAIASRPKDAVAAFEFNLHCAEIYAIAGLVNDATKMTETLLRPPSNFSIYMIDLDPVFDGIREAPEFVAMLEQHR